ncbi:MAG: hypothetical protein FJ406_13210 [Verrucomicrobia bacterium]|nr:hypothetical protein [Verrucomicrobiota bacterium]
MRKQVTNQAARNGISSFSLAPGFSPGFPGAFGQPHFQGFGLDVANIPWWSAIELTAPANVFERLFEG